MIINNNNNITYIYHYLLIHYIYCIPSKNIFIFTLLIKYFKGNINFIYKYEL